MRILLALLVLVALMWRVGGTDSALLGVQIIATLGAFIAGVAWYLAVTRDNPHG